MLCLYIQYTYMVLRRDEIIKQTELPDILSVHMFRVEAVRWLERDRNRLNEYSIDVIPAIISLDMVSGMYNHMALRETTSC